MTPSQPLQPTAPISPAAGLQAEPRLSGLLGAVPRAGTSSQEESVTAKATDVGSRFAGALPWARRDLSGIFLAKGSCQRSP